MKRYRSRLFFLYSIICIFPVVVFIPTRLDAQEQTEPVAPKPLYSDPVYDGAADPTVIWNEKEKKWFMFYTNRRASDQNARGVTWVHGTRIGIAESTDGATWVYRDTANINYRPDEGYTFWAPEVINNEGLYHMYLTYVPGIFTDWKHPRWIIHLTSSDLLNWKYEGTLKLASEKVIDPCVLKLPNGGWRMWYNNESDAKSIYYADSRNLYNWTDKGKAIHDMPGEGPNAFKWKGHYWMIVDNWKGLGVYSSDDLLNWKRQEERLVEKPGAGKDDQAIGGHPYILVNDDRAFLFYFTHPGRVKNAPLPADPVLARRSVIQITELKFRDSVLTCDRDLPVHIHLEPYSQVSNNPLKGDLAVHDPCMIKQGDTYYIFSTGRGINIKTSRDRIHWKNAGHVFGRDAPPAWQSAHIPLKDVSLWAPDIHYQDSKFYLYYAVSAWMNFNSSIGFATNTTLDSADAAYKWVDGGEVVNFRNGGEGVNVIDPNVFLDGDGKEWLIYGSYKAGLRLLQLDPATGKPFSDRPEITTITTSLGEGSYLIKTQEYYYVFASRGICCKGVKSTYQMVMGRSKDIKGPYLNKEGESWLDNKYSVFLAGDYDEPGRGHNGFFAEHDTVFILYHAYTRSANGASLLNIRPVYLDADGWPTPDATGKLFRMEKGEMKSFIIN